MSKSHQLSVHSVMWCEERKWPNFVDFREVFICNKVDVGEQGLHLRAALKQRKTFLVSWVIKSCQSVWDEIFNCGVITCRQVTWIYNLKDEKYEMLTLSERGDTWHLASHIKQLPCLPETKKIQKNNSIQSLFQTRPAHKNTHTT